LLRGRFARCRRKEQQCQKRAASRTHARFVLRFMVG
jgi:hypothetical protein